MVIALSAVSVPALSISVFSATARAGDGQGLRAAMSFRFLDQNGDGVLSREELVAHPHYAVDLFDVDGDGAITEGDAFLAGTPGASPCAAALAVSPVRHVVPATFAGLRDRTCGAALTGDELRSAQGLRP